MIRLRSLAACTAMSDVTGGGQRWLERARLFLKGDSAASAFIAVGAADPAGGRPCACQPWRTLLPVRSGRTGWGSLCSRFITRASRSQSGRRPNQRAFLNFAASRPDAPPRQQSPLRGLVPRRMTRTGRGGSAELVGRRRFHRGLAKVWLAATVLLEVPRPRVCNRSALLHASATLVRPDSCPPRPTKSAGKCNGNPETRPAEDRSRCARPRCAQQALPERLWAAAGPVRGYAARQPAPHDRSGFSSGGDTTSAKLLKFCDLIMGAQEGKRPLDPA